jgi:hypothetical protein
MHCRHTLAGNVPHVCDGCDAKALNCEPIANLKEKIELSNLHKTNS